MIGNAVCHLFVGIALLRVSIGHMKSEHETVLERIVTHRESGGYLFET